MSTLKDRQPLVTIIVPCYNHQDYVRETIESIVKQTYKNIELIVIDDGSTDDSPLILAELSQKYNFYFEHHKNIGLSATLNKAIKMAKGEYISAIASDDLITPDKIEILINEFKNVSDEYALVCGNANFIDNSSNSISLRRGNKDFFTFIEYYTCNKKNFDITNDFGKYSLILQSNYLPALSVLVKKKAIYDVGLYEEDISLEDWNMWLKLSKQYKFKYRDKVVASYRVHQNNSFNMIKNKLSMDVIKILEREKFYCIEHDHLNIWRKNYYNAIYPLFFEKKHKIFIKKILQNNVFFYCLHSIRKSIVYLYNKIPL